MDCKEISEPVLLTNLFREKNEKELHRVFKCFYENYYRIFVLMLRRISKKHAFLKNDVEFYASQAFNDGLLSFYDTVSKKGFAEREAKIKTFFFAFCLNKLRALITSQYRTGDKQAKLIRATEHQAESGIEAEDIGNEQAAILQKALNMLDEKRRKYIILRKMHHLTNEQIAEKMGIEPGTVNNEVHKSFRKLKENVEMLTRKK
ncbi:MAG TPA: sigma-70 family RNA polymerase sigma factor [Puia sp.]|nr:sigma-70 family RNA polymerase sigma factor [Puia sp.]